MIDLASVNFDAIFAAEDPTRAGDRRPLPDPYSAEDLAAALKELRQ